MVGQCVSVSIDGPLGDRDQGPRASKDCALRHRKHARQQERHPAGLARIRDVGTRQSAGGSTGQSRRRRWGTMAWRRGVPGDGGCENPHVRASPRHPSSDTSHFSHTRNGRSEPLRPDFADPLHTGHIRLRRHAASTARNPGSRHDHATMKEPRPSRCSCNPPAAPGVPRREGI